MVHLLISQCYTNKKVKLHRQHNRFGKSLLVVAGFELDRVLLTKPHLPPTFPILMNVCKECYGISEALWLMENESPNWLI